MLLLNREFKLEEKLMLTNFLESITQAANNFVKIKPSSIILIHHNDTDGICAGAILSKTFMRMGIMLRRYSLEKPYPLVLEKLLKDIDPKAIIFITDFASGMLSQITQVTKNKVFVLDHHAIDPNYSNLQDSITLVSPLTHGLLGSDASASAICFEFALALDANNQDLANLGALGAFGDGYFKENNFSGLNQRAYQLAIEQALITAPKLFNLQISIEAESLVKAIDILGSAAYFDSGPDIAIKGLIDQETVALLELARKKQIIFDQKYNQFCGNLEYKQSKNIQWFDLSRSCSEFGVKSVGLFCNRLLSDPKTNQDKYLAGFQIVSDRIPGLGNIKINQTKVSMRIPTALLEKVQKAQFPDLTKLLVPATSQLNGFVDACHPAAAATTINIGLEQKLIDKMQEILEQI